MLVVLGFKDVLVGGGGEILGGLGIWSEVGCRSGLGFKDGSYAASRREAEIVSAWRRGAEIETPEVARSD